MADFHPKYKLNLDNDHVPGELFVRFAPATEKGDHQRAFQNVQAEVIGTFESSGAYHVRIPAAMDSKSLLAAAERIHEITPVEWIQENGIFQQEEDDEDGPEPRADPPDEGGPGPDQVEPLDDHYYKQWALKRIRADRVWKTHTGRDSVRVAVLDSGIDCSHPDLVHNLRGALSFVTGEDPEDIRGHGTRVAGIIGAQGDNRIGIAGVCWRVSLHSYKVIAKGGGLILSSAIQAVEHATREGIDVLNLSWELDSNYGDLEMALARASAQKQLIAVAAANDGRDISSHPRYPAYYRLPHMLTVGASSRSPDDTRHWVSNYSRCRVHLLAPGEEIYTTKRGGGYGYMHNGTSAATPFVAGGAALLKGSLGLDADEVRDRLLAGVRPLPGAPRETITDGRLDLQTALWMPRPAPVPLPKECDEGDA